MRRLIARQDDFSGGMNSRDNPKFLKSNECQKLVNVYPGRQAQGRQAIQCIHAAYSGGTLPASAYSGADELAYIQQFILCEGNNNRTILLARRGEELVGAFVDETLKNQTSYIKLSTSRFTTSYTPNGVHFIPIGVKQVLILGRDVIAPFVVDYADATFLAVGTGVNARSIIDGVLIWKTELDTTFPGGTPTLGVSISAGVGDPVIWASDCWIRYVVTLVRRDENISLPVLETTYTAGMVETSKFASTTFEIVGGTTQSDVTLTVPDPGDIDGEASHWRIYRTQGTIAGSGLVTSEAEALGMPLLWLADVPINGANQTFTYADTTPDDVLTGEYQYNYDGITGLPDPIDHAFVAKGRLWVAEKGASLNAGRWWISLPPPDATNITKHLFMFDIAGTYSLDGGETTVPGWVDTSLDDTDYVRGGALVGDDAILWNRESMWRVASADPINGVEAVSRLGCHAPNTITVVEDKVMWLSPEGPAMYQGGVVDKMEFFKAKEVWPRNYSSPDGGGEFFDGRDADAIVAAWANDTWHIAYNPMTRPVVSISVTGTTVEAAGTTYTGTYGYWPEETEFVWIACHMPANPESRGPFEIKPSASILTSADPALILPAPPANSISGGTYAKPYGWWRELESRTNAVVNNVTPTELDQRARTPWTEMMPQHFRVYRGNLYWNTGCNAPNTVGSEADSGYALANLLDGNTALYANIWKTWIVWGGYLLKLGAKDQGASRLGQDEHPSCYLDDFLATWDPAGGEASCLDAYPIAEVSTRLMPTASKLYQYGEALDVRVGTWAHSSPSGVTYGGNGEFTQAGLEYNHRTNRRIDFNLLLRDTDDNQDGQDPYNGYNVSGITARDWFQQILPDGYISAYFGARVRVALVPFDGNTPSSVDWLEIGYIPRKNWGPTLVSNPTNQAVE